MKGDRRHHQHGTASEAASISPSPKFLAFQRRTTPLDWRRIASLDLEKVLQEGDPSPLEELTNPILFCKAEIEFERNSDDNNEIDPGFIKVFKLSQLIGECLLFRLRQSETNYDGIQQKIKSLESDKKKLAGETVHLRDHLTLAMKELRRRRELLESLGSSGGIHIAKSPLDDFHQCPYCVKRFLISIYLHAHIQRRHQGLPVVPMFSPQIHLQSSGTVATTFPIINSHGVTSSSIVNQSFSPVDRGFVRRRDSCTQTPGPGDESSSVPVPSTVRTETNSGRSEGEVRQDCNNDAGGDGEGNVPEPTTKGFKTENDGNELDNKSSSEVMTVIKSPPTSGWNHQQRPNNLQSTNEEGEVPPDEDYDNHQGQLSSAEDILSRKASIVSSPGGGAQKVPTIATIVPKGPSSSSSRLDIKTICNLIETYLEQKSVPGRNERYEEIVRTLEECSSAKYQGTQGDKKSWDENKNNSSPDRGDDPSDFFSSLRTEGGQFTKADKLFLSRTEQVEKDVIRMKDEFESQWRDLSERVRNAGIQNLQGTLLLSEIKKVQDILQSPSRPISRNENNHEVNEEGAPVKNENTGEISPEGNNTKSSLEKPLELIQEVVEERLQKQTMDLQQLKSALEMKMESELQKMKACLEEQNEFWRQQIVQQSKADLTNLQKDDDSLHNDEISPVEKTSTKMQMGILEGPSSFSSSQRQRDDQSKVIVTGGNDSALLLGKPSHESNMTCHRDDDDDYDDTNKAGGKSVNELSHHKTCDPREEEPDDDDDDVILIPIPKPRKHQQKSSASSCAPIKNNLLDSRKEIHKNEYDVDNGEFAREGNEFGSRGHEISEEEIRYVTHERKHESAGAGESSRESGTARVLSGKINHVTKEMQNELKLKGAAGTGKIPGDRMKYLDYVAETYGSKNDNRSIPKSLERVRRQALQSESEEEDDDELSGRNDELDNSIHSTSSHSQFTLLSDEEKRAREGDDNMKPKVMKVVFDEKKGKLVEAWKVSTADDNDYYDEDDSSASSQAIAPTVVKNFGESQLELVRKKTLQEVDEELENIGINPEASSISLGEMSRALRVLKSSKRKGSSSLEDRESLAQIRSEVLGDLNQEMTKKSIHQKLEEHSGGGRVSVSSGIGTSPLAKMLHKVKKSGSSWKKKVAFAMRRKQNSPSSPKKNKLQAELAAATAGGTGSSKASSEVKTSFFSKSHWVRKNKKSRKNKKNESDIQKEVSGQISSGEERSEEDSSEYESSEMAVEMPPYLTKSKPVSTSPTYVDDDEKEITGGNRLKRNDNPAVVDEKHDEKMMRVVSPNRSLKEFKNTRQSDSSHGINNKSTPEVVDGVNKKEDGDRKGKRKWKNDSSSSNIHLVPSLFSAKSNGGTLNNNNNNKSIIPTSSSGKGVVNNVKCPNFFVKESPSKRDDRSKAGESINNVSRTFPRVTSNGWSSSGENNVMDGFHETAGNKNFKSMKELSAKNAGGESFGVGGKREEMIQKGKEHVSPGKANDKNSLKAWQKDFLNDLPTSSSSSEFDSESDEKEGSSGSSEYSQKKQMKGQGRDEEDSMGKFARNESNRVAFRKRHPNNSTSISEDDLEEDDDESHVGIKRNNNARTRNDVKRRAVNSRSQNVERKESNKVNGNSSDTSIWEDVEEEEDDELGESESRDLPPPVQRSLKDVKNVGSNSNGGRLNNPGKSSSSGERGNIPGSKSSYGNNNKRSKSRSPGENSWDS